MTQHLKPHKKHMEEKHAAHENMLKNGIATGVQCPLCDGELMDMFGVKLLTSPPQTPVTCNKCGHGDII